MNDHEPLQLQVLQTFRARGFDARGADNGRTALALARSDRPDVIVVDLDPPAVDGWDAIRRLKTDPMTRHILVVALSEDGQTERRNLAMRVGCDAFAAKPVDVDHLVDSVEQLLPA